MTVLHAQQCWPPILSGADQYVSDGSNGSWHKVELAEQFGDTKSIKSSLQKAILGSGEVDEKSMQMAIINVGQLVMLASVILRHPYFLAQKKKKKRQISATFVCDYLSHNGFSVSMTKSFAIGGIVFLAVVCCRSSWLSTVSASLGLS